MAAALCGLRVPHHRRVLRRRRLHEPADPSGAPGVVAGIAALFLFIAAIPAGFAPRRYWQSLDVHLPVTQTALLSAIAAVFLGAAIGIPAYLNFAQQSASAAVDMMLQAAGWKPVPPGATPTIAGAQL